MDALDRFFAGGDCALVGAARCWTGGALLPGSFNPVHDAHWRLAKVAGDILGKPVAFELSVVNVDKPSLTAAETRQRLQPFAGRADVWLTRAPRFVDKAAHFPDTVFVVGADTAQRLVIPRYYGGDERRMLEALDMIAQHGCRFLVAGRVDAAGRFLTLEDLVISQQFRALFTAIPEQVFRLDISSTALRGGNAPAW
jgi:hypothetical protein